MGSRLAVVASSEFSVFAIPVPSKRGLEVGRQGALNSLSHCEIAQIFYLGQAAG